ncbi:MAG: RluA family pseudouridine synthase [Anaerolineae bacterium]|nr:RluA family pseudouridine synthase [Anaerolineae bacterium]
MTNSTETVVVAFDAAPEIHVGMRLDLAIVDVLAGRSRAQIQRFIKDGFVTVDGRLVKASYRLEGREHIVVRIPPPLPVETAPEAIPLDVIYEDDDLAVINKPAGMVVHPAYGNREGTLVNAALARWPQIASVGGRDRAGIVHRLDKDTSGVILIAKTEPARLTLMRQFAQRTIQKYYLALVEGHPPTPEGQINAPVGRDPKQRKRMAVVRGGREAVTVYRVLEWYDEYALVRAEPLTGRTHQIRVHMRFIGCPIVGDPVYGRRKGAIRLGYQFLHAAGMTFAQPSTGEKITIEALLPPDLQTVLDRLRHENGLEI